MSAKAYRLHETTHQVVSLQQNTEKSSFCYIVLGVWGGTWGHKQTSYHPPYRDFAWICL